jgi:hypothetical protein
MKICNFTEICVQLNANKTDMNNAGNTSSQLSKQHYFENLTVGVGGFEKKNLT